MNTLGRSLAPMSRPSRRETLTPWFTEAVKVIDVRVVWVPTVGSTSSHCASKRPIPGMMSSGVGAPGLVVDRAQVLRQGHRPAAHHAVQEARGDLALAVSAGRGRHELAGGRAQRGLGADRALAVDRAGVLGEVDRRDGGAGEGDDQRDDGDDHGGGRQAKLHDDLLRRGSAGPYCGQPGPDAGGAASRTTRRGQGAPADASSPHRRAAGAVGRLHHMQTTLIHIALAQANTGRR